MSDGGKKALASYAKGVRAMLKLPPDPPQNWFRNAFIHIMDCPHGELVVLCVWHRGYLGYFEQTIRNLSGGLHVCRLLGLDYAAADSGFHVRRRADAAG